MEVYSIERDGVRNENQLQPSASVASSLSTQVLVPTDVTQASLSTIRVKKWAPRGTRSSKNCFYTFTCATAFLFVLCFLVMSVVTVKLLINNYHADLNSSVQNGTNYTLNTNRKLEQESLESTSLPTFNQYEKNFLKFILTNLTSSLNKSSGSPVRGGGSSATTIHADDPFFERNLFSWLKNTFKMAFLGKLDATSDTKQPNSPGFSGKFGVETIDGSLLNAVPFSKKTPLAGSGGLIDINLNFF
jgi:hypothetical protein